MPLLEVSGLSIDYDGSRLVEGVSFLVGRGDRFAIVGEKGFDKTLIGLALAGLLPKEARRGGEIKLDNAPMPVREGALAKVRGDRIGMLFADGAAAANPHMKLAAQLGEAVKGMRRDAVPGIEVPRLLGEVGLDATLGSMRPHELTATELQRGMLALALARNPAMLVADEPFAGLDLIGQRQIIDLIVEVSTRRGLALILISDNLRAVATICSRVMVVEEGHIVEAGKVSSVFGHPREAYTKRLIAAAKPVIRTLARPPAGGPLLTLRDVNRTFRNPPRAAIDDVGFVVNSSESVALVGPAGSGKTALARIIAGLDRGASGEMTFDRQTFRAGRPPKAVRRQIALVFADPLDSFDPRRTIGDAIGTALRVVPSLVAVERKARIAEALGLVGLGTDMLSRFPREFTRGQLQRFAIARAMVTRPLFVVLDEPVKALDMPSRNDVLALLTRLRSDLGLTYLVISDDPDTVGVIADRVLIISEGKIVETGKPGELLHSPRHPVTQALISARLPQLSALLAAERPLVPGD